MTPTSITNFERTDSELQEFWIFCLFVAGKNSDVAARKTREFLSERGNLAPFEYLSMMNIQALLQVHKVGQYSRMERALAASLSLDLRNDPLERLMGVHGIGPKTARFFLLHSRKQCRCAVLDTHILKWINALGVACPKVTPTSIKEYERIERHFLTLAEAHHPSLPIAQLDLLLWGTISGRFEAENVAV